MGMESFFYSLNVHAPLARGDVEALLARHSRIRTYSTLRGIRRRRRENAPLSLDNRTVVEISCTNECARLTFEACFADYENSLRYLFEIAVLLMTLGPVELIPPGGKALPLDPDRFEAFRAALNQSHETKYRWFIAHCGSQQSRHCLPNRFFSAFRKR